MNFRAFIRRSSEVYQRWRRESRIGGVISGVPFTWNGRDYVSDDPLHPDFVSAIKDNSYIQLALSGAPVGQVAVIEPAEEPKPTPEKPRVTLTLPQQKGPKR